MSQQLWDARFIDLAAEVANWSKDPSTPVGCVIIDPQRRIVSTGYNGFPKGIDDDGRLLDRTIKYRLTLHAEHNAILFAQRDLSGCTLYVWPMPPCAHCAAQIIQVGIGRVVSLPPDKGQLFRWGDDWELAHNILLEAGVDVADANYPC